MRKNLSLFIFIAIAAIVAFIYLYFRQYTPKYRWTENYDYESKQPYGLKLFHDLLSGSRSKGDFVMIKDNPETFIQANDTNAIYVVVGAYYTIDSVTCNALLSFVARGNNVFISSNGSEQAIFDTITHGRMGLIYYQYYESSYVNINFTEGNANNWFYFDYRSGKKLQSRQWQGIHSATMNDTLAEYGFKPLSYLPYGLVDAYKISYGKGYFIFHSNPVLLTNYYLRTSNGLRYVNRLFTGFEKRKVYWDEFSKSAQTGNEQNGHESPLKFILSERSLRWSWFVLCFVSIIYLVFNLKRRQRHIPLVPAVKNASLEYIKAVASVHFQNKSYEYIAGEMLKQFHAFVKHKYQLAPMKENKDMAAELSRRAKVSEENILEIYNRHFNVRFDPVFNVDEFIGMYKAIEYFYSNCK
jgi:hypothetical protein